MANIKGERGNQQSGISPTPEQRFWAKVDKSSECWVWTAGRQHFGHGKFRPNGSAPHVLAHRFSYELAYGPIPDGLFVLHKCDNPPCVRPDHLFLGTQDDNMKDKVRKGRQAKGPENGRSKLTWEQAAEIRRRFPFRKKGEIVAWSREFGVNEKSVLQIGRGELYVPHETRIMTTDPFL